MKGYDLKRILNHNPFFCQAYLSKKLPELPLNEKNCVGPEKMRGGGAGMNET